MIEYILLEKQENIEALFVVFLDMWIQEKLLFLIKLEELTFKRVKQEELLSKLVLHFSLIKN
jgi:hypothetical protein